MSNNIKAKPSHEVEFVLTDNHYWVIYSKDFKDFIYSKHNNWVDDIFYEKPFDYLHEAVAVAKKKGFKFEIPKYEFTLTNDNLEVYLNGSFFTIIKHVSEEIAHNFIRSTLRIKISKMKEYEIKTA